MTELSPCTRCPWNSRSRIRSGAFCMVLCMLQVCRACPTCGRGAPSPPPSGTTLPLQPRIQGRPGGSGLEHGAPGPTTQRAAPNPGRSCALDAPRSAQGIVADGHNRFFGEVQGNPAPAWRCPLSRLQRVVSSPAVIKIHEGGGLAARTYGVLTMHATRRPRDGWPDRRWGRDRPQRSGGDGGPMGGYVLGFEDIDQTQVALVGGKGAHLGELSRIAGIHVPPGFCVTTDAFRRIIEEAPRSNVSISCRA